MFTKIYDKIKHFLKETYILIIAFALGIFLSLYELPYYISAPGGVISVSSKIKIEDAYEVKGSFNMAYVAEYKATLPMLLLAKLNSDWDIQKKSDVLSSTETDETVYIRNRLLLEESYQSAIIYAYEKAGKPVNITNTQVYVAHIYEEAHTNLKVGDQIVSINDDKIDNKETLYEAIQKANVGDILSIKVINNNNEFNRYAEVINVEGFKLIAIMVSQLRDYRVEPSIKIDFKNSESGPSGGLIMSLSIYNYLTEEDITKGKKIAGTGTIDEMGNVGSIGGVEYKIKGAVKDKIKYFLIPAGENYEEAMKIKEKKKYDIEIVPVSTFDEALEYLKSI